LVCAHFVVRMRFSGDMADRSLMRG
jgi:hypothetical protein